MRAKNAKNHLRDFLNYLVQGRPPHRHQRTADMVIHTGKQGGQPGGRALRSETVRGKNDTRVVEMISQENLAPKPCTNSSSTTSARRSEYRNTDLKYLVITDIYRWFVFDAADFDKLFHQNRRLQKVFQDWRDGIKTRATEFFYQEIARPFVENLGRNCPAYFRPEDFEKLLLQQPQDDDKLIPL